jgi:DNA-binding CsgD family transcriptional regulator
MQFDLQPTTVAAHLVAINRRFGVPKRDEALRAAYDLGLVKRPGPKPKRDAAGLSERHKSVLKAFAAGHSRSQIVAEMDLSPGSINRLGREAIALLGATSQADAAAIAKGRGLI